MKTLKIIMKVKTSFSSSFWTDYDHPLNLSIAFSLPDAAAGALDLGFGIATFRTFSLFLSREPKLSRNTCLTLLKTLMMTRKRMTRSDILPGTTLAIIGNKNWNQSHQKRFWKWLEVGWNKWNMIRKKWREILLPDRWWSLSRKRLQREYKGCKPGGNQEWIWACKYNWS